MHFIILNSLLNFCSEINNQITLYLAFALYSKFIIHQCAACGYPSAKLRRFDGWGLKVRGRKGQGTGRMRYMKTVGRRAKNGFRSGTMQKQFTGRKAK